MSAPTRMLFAALAAGSLLLTGCSGGDPSSGQGPEGPLDEYRMAAYGSEVDEETYYVQQAAIEELIASCMREEGFDYIPQSFEGLQGQTFFGDDEDPYEGPDWGTVEFARQFGYGIVDSPWSEWSSEGSDADPNDAHVQSLSESEQAAYYEALHGPDSLWDHMGDMEDGEEMPPQPALEEQGCWGKSQAAQLSPEQKITEKPEYAALITGMNEIWMQVEDSPKMQELNKQWAACMDKGGYPGHTKIDEASTQLQTEYHDLMVWPEDDERDAQPQEPDAAQKKAFLAKEIAAATVDFTCQEQLKVESKQQAIVREIEQEFLDAHKAELDALVAELNRVSSSKKQGE